MTRSCRLTIAALAAVAVLLGDFLPARAESVSAEGWWRITAYCYTGHRTASGTWPRYGSVAAPRSVPFGTVLDIPGYSEEAVVEDRGGAIVGRRLDVYFPNCAAAWAWGVRWVNVTYSEYGE